MNRRHPADTAILAGLIIGHIAGAIVLARIGIGVRDFLNRNNR